MQPINWDIVASYSKGLWAVGGPLLGVLVGAYVANRNQKKHWVADNKKEEYRELLSVMTKAKTLYSSVNAGLIEAGPERENALNSAMLNVNETINSRLFIAPIVERLAIQERWNEAAIAFDDGSERTRFPATVNELLRQLRESARLDMGA